MITTPTIAVVPVTETTQALGEVELMDRISFTTALVEVEIEDQAGAAGLTDRVRLVAILMNRAAGVPRGHRLEFGPPLSGWARQTLRVARQAPLWEVVEAVMPPEMRISPHDREIN